jgi:hypothetical protein
MSAPIDFLQAVWVAMATNHPVLDGLIIGTRLRLHVRGCDRRYLSVGCAANGVMATIGETTDGGTIVAYHQWTVPYTDETVITKLGQLVEEHLCAGVYW